MFTKNTEKLEAMIGANSHFRGDIDTKGTLRIDGTLVGNVSADWVIVGEKSSIKGDIVSRGIVVGGRIEGNLKAKEIVEIKSKGQVYGDIHTSKFTILEGGVFDGRSNMAHEESKIVEFQAKG
ncbi:MAG TPA: polymer-forming cytoskeletal protein [Thermodesulfovibrionales bacterium]|nr:polymer-forming cytoskeletal protein [Thermodesulfovibrionales bacterium]